jgi:hypothetical protein
MNDYVSTAASLAVPVIAQISAVDQQSAAIWWIVGLAAAAAGANQIVLLWRNLSPSRDRRHVSLEQEPQSKAACEKLHTAITEELRRLHEAFTQGFERYAREAEQRASGLHKRVDPIAADVARVNGRLDDHLQDHRSKRG